MLICKKKGNLSKHFDLLQTCLLSTIRLGKPAKLRRRWTEAIPTPFSAARMTKVWMTEFQSQYIAAGGNRHPAAADWDPISGLLAYGAENNVALWKPLVVLFSTFCSRHAHHLDRMMATKVCKLYYEVMRVRLMPLNSCYCHGVANR